MTVPPAERSTRYLAVFLRWFLIAAAVFAFVYFSGTYVINNVLPKIYTATALVEVSPSGRRSVQRVCSDLAAHLRLRLLRTKNADSSAG